MSISLKLQNWNPILDFYLNEKCIYELYYDPLIFNPKFKRSWYTVRDQAMIADYLLPL